MDKKQTLTEQVARLIKQHLAVGPLLDSGFTSEAVRTLVKQNLPDYNPDSTSPALSHLTLVGVVRREPTNGAYFYVRDFTARDLKRIRDHNNKNKAKRDGAPAGAAMIAIALGENRTEVVDIAQAKRIFLSLKPLFES